MKLPLSIAVLSIFLIASTAIAQSKGKPKFFEPHYAEKVMGNSPPVVGLPDSSELNGNTRMEPVIQGRDEILPKSDHERVPTIDDSSPVGEETPSESGEGTPSPTPGNVVNVLDGKPSNKVRALNLIINAADAEHFKESINELIDTANEYQLPIRYLYMIGQPAGEMNTSSVGLRLWRFGGEIQYLDSPPAKYPTAHSPSWVVETDHGEMLIEGLSLRSFLNSRGEFVAR